MKMEKLFDGTDDKFRLGDIAAGDVISYRNQHYLMDPENFHFADIDARESKIDKQKIKKFLDDKKINIPVDDFMVLWNFQVWVQEKYPDRKKNEALRSPSYFQMLKNSRENPMPLSDAFNRKIAMCTEMSALAQMYLQHREITSVIYSGNAFTDPNQNINFGGIPHAWLMITLGGKKYFYDPANPIITNNMLLPAIMDYSKIKQSEIHDFEEIIHKPTKEGGGFAYLEAADVYSTGRRWLYGFQHGLLQNRTEKAVKRFIPIQKSPIPPNSGRGL